MFSLLQGSPGTIASEGSDIPQVLWTRVNRLCQVGNSVQRQPVFALLSPVARRRMARQSSPVPLFQHSPVRSLLFCSSWPSTPIMAQPPKNLEDLLILLQQTIDSLQQDMTTEVTNRLQQQQQQSAAASASHAPNVATPTPDTTANTAQDPLGVPITLVQTDPVSVQMSRAPAEALCEFEFHPTLLKVNKFEKLFKKTQGVSSIPDIEDGYTESVVTLPERFKMSHIDCFNGSRDPMVYLRLFSDILRPMGLTKIQKLLLFGRTISSIAAIWYAKLEDSVKQSWQELAKSFVAQYFYNTQIEVTTRDLEVTRQELKGGLSEFVIRWRAKAAKMANRPPEKEQVRIVVRNLHKRLLQKMIVLPLFNFKDLHEIGVQIEDAIRKMDHCGRQ
ncbi:hypothetical protein ACSBR1_008373 [Camellia fascicularis]